MTFYSLRSYRDNGQHYEGQLGDEATPAEFLRNLWAVMDECHRVLKASGSAFIELGEKYSGTGGGNGQSGLVGAKPFLELGRADNRGHPRNNTKQTTGWARPKSLMGLPWAFALGLINPDLFRSHIDPGEHPRWILRAEIIWHRLNGLPESVTDRVRRSHSAIFHLVKSERYYSAVDEIRESYSLGTAEKYASHTFGLNKYAGVVTTPSTGNGRDALQLEPNPLGKLPGSVWSLPSEPLLIPKWAEERYNLPPHFAAWPQEIPRRLILGFSPPGICTVCNEGRRPMVEKRPIRLAGRTREAQEREGVAHANGRSGFTQDVTWQGFNEATILGYACSCTPYTDHEGRGQRVPGNWLNVDPGNTPRQLPVSGGVGKAERTGPWREYHFSGWTPPATRPAVILDPFSGTGTTIGVARALGRVGVGIDLSADYARLARWRVFESSHFKKAEQRTWRERQGTIPL